MKKLTTEIVIAQFKETHADKFDYSLVEYINDRKKVKIICSLHGVFESTPSNHKRGAECSFCKGKFKTQKSIIEDFKKVHGDKYNYDLVVFSKVKIKVKIICSLHGVFEQEPSIHIIKIGCPTCAGKNTNTKSVIKQFKKTHGDKFDYSLVDYVNSETPVKIICSVHGIFKQRVTHHRRGVSCPSCSPCGFRPKDKAILYYVKINAFDKVAYKIGITNNSVEQRFRGDIKKVTILKTWSFESGRKCFEREQEILKRFKFAKYTGIDLLISGNTELFDRDVFAL